MIRHTVRTALLSCTLALCALPAHAEDSDCTPEAAQDMLQELRDDLRDLSQSLMTDKSIRLRKEKVGYVLVTQPLPVPERLKQVPSELSKIEDLLQKKSPTTCDEIEKMRHKYRL